MAITTIASVAADISWVVFARHQVHCVCGLTESLQPHHEAHTVNIPFLSDEDVAMWRLAGDMAYPASRSSPPNLAAHCGCCRVSWDEECPPQSTSTWPLRLWPYLQTGSLQMRLVKMRSYWIRVGPESNDWCPWRRPREDRETRRGGTKTEAEMGGASPGQGEPGVADSHRKLGDLGADSSSESQEGTKWANSLAANV